MAITKTIKDVDEQTWVKFRAMAVKNRMKTGQLFRKIIDEHEKHSASAWDKILYHEPLMTEKEAKAMEKLVRERRKEYGFRT